MEWIFQVWFGFVSVLRKTAGSVRFQFGFEKNRRFDFLCRSVVKYKKTCKLSFLCVHFLRFLNAQLVSNACFLKFNLNFNLNHIVYVYMMPNMPLSSVCKVKNVKVL